MKQIDIELGKSVVRYSPDNGDFRWVRAYRKPSFAGRIATRSMTSGYLYVKAGGRNHSASRLAWRVMNGPIPSGMEIDHINRVKTDNRIENLRLATRSHNMMNTQVSPNRVGSRGVSIHKQSGLYRARHRDKTLYFETLEGAIAGYAQLISKRLRENS